MTFEIGYKSADKNTQHTEIYMTEKFCARINDDGRSQTLVDHLNGVALMAEAFADSFGAGRWARLAGRWHDIGKYSHEFQNRLKIQNDLDSHIEQASGKPDHSTAGAQFADSALGKTGKVLAYPIAGHHAGLPNGKDENQSCLFRRLDKPIPDWSSCPAYILETENPGNPPFKPDLKGKRFGFQVSFFIRMLYSCLVDADFLDTEKFMDPDKSSWREGYPSLESLNEILTVHLEKLIKDAKQTKINRYRSEILNHCLAAATKTPGLFSLTVPTGGGKTLSSLAFALKHALRHGFQRVIYVIPYTSIIEQNAKVFRDILGDGAVLEHHSTFDFKDEKDEDRRSRLSAENWDAPLIVTTSVQFFESLFHNRSSKCRKIHNISNSLIILDEAQMLPVRFLRPCVETLRELSSGYNTSIVLCTATQPALSSEQFKWRLELPDEREIMPEPEKLYVQFRRVETEYIGKFSEDEIADKLSEHPQVLCVVNTRKHARVIYEKIDGEGCYHLSALMCPSHRSEKLEEIRKALINGETCRVVSTQLIEAGVDIDFPVVFRAAAGIDSIAQAAGRCNREGKNPKGGKVYVFMPESGLPPGDFRLNAETAELVMRHHKDVLSPEAVREYFKANFWLRGDDQLDREGILEDLWEGAPTGDFPFKKIAAKFRIIEDGMEPIIILYNETAEKLATQLRYAEHSGGLARKLQRYIVQVPPRVLVSLENAGAVERIQKRFCILMNRDIYDENLGLCPDDPTFYKAENLIF